MQNTCLLDFSTIWSAQHLGYGLNPSEREPVDCLSALLEAAVLFDRVFVPYVPARSSGMHDFLSPLLREGIVERTEASDDDLAYLRQYVSGLLSSPGALLAFIDALSYIVRLPGFRELRDLFGHHGVFRYFEDVDESGLLLPPDICASEFMSAAQSLARRDYYRDRDQFQIWLDANIEQVASFILRGLCYSELARLRSTAFFPHPLRSASVVCEANGVFSGHTRVTEELLTFVEHLREELVDGRLGTIGRGFVEVAVPPIASVILRSAASVAEIVGEVRRYRELRSTRALRDWIGRVQEALKNGEGAEFLAWADELKRLRHQMLLEFGVIDAEVKVNLWILSYASKIPRWLQRGIYRTLAKRNVQFIYDCVKRSTAITSLRPDILRLFWPEVPPNQRGMILSAGSHHHFELGSFDYSSARLNRGDRTRDRAV